ncbi:antimicrobial peptide microplusin [Rhipicephalus sanguineus]|uniref:antimicrobial peptide microplusin n=1 Tax=Rhipicephalus sanguineus TaxID=34632 RepID=UPI001894A905|nr:antimicrobial peptide microplusin [Rhipicephalus sanguineus]
MKSVFAICFLVVIFVTAASAHHLELCGKPDWQLVRELSCITSRLSRRTLQAFSNAVWHLKCPNYACAIRRMCFYNDLEGAMSYFFNWIQIKHFHRVASVCARRYQGTWGPNSWQSTYPTYGQGRMFF